MQPQTASELNYDSTTIVAPLPITPGNNTGSSQASAPPIPHTYMEPPRPAEPGSEGGEGKSALHRVCRAVFAGPLRGLSKFVLPPGSLRSRREGVGDSFFAAMHSGLGSDEAFKEAVMRDNEIVSLRVLSLPCMFPVQLASHSPSSVLTMHGDGHSHSLRRNSDPLASCNNIHPPFHPPPNPRSHWWLACWPPSALQGYSRRWRRAARVCACSTWVRRS